MKIDLKMIVPKNGLKFGTTFLIDLQYGSQNEKELILLITYNIKAIVLCQIFVNISKLRILT